MTAPAPHGTPAALREFIAEHACLAHLFLSHAIDCASIGDDFGLAVALRKHGILMQAVHDTYRELSAEKQGADDERTA
jgi:hypothetical protein